MATNNDNQRPFEIYARNNAGTTGQWALDIGVELLQAMENYTDIPYYTMAENMNMKQAAIPDFSAGAMENWGLLTYRLVHLRNFIRILRLSILRFLDLPILYLFLYIIFRVYNIQGS